LDVSSCRILGQQKAVAHLEPQKAFHELRQSLDHMLFTAFNNFSQRRFSPDGKDSVAFTTALVSIIQEDEQELRPGQLVSSKPRPQPQQYSQRVFHFSQQTTDIDVDATKYMDDLDERGAHSGVQT
jgi:hypothetical protein